MSNNAGRYGFAVWIGAAFYWMLSGFKKSFRECESKQNERRNLWTAYVLYLILAAAGTLIFVFTI